jgi:hypothetical protein
VAAMTIATSPVPAAARFGSPVIETVGGIEFGRCRCCGCRMDAARAKAKDSTGLCFICGCYGPRRRGVPVDRYGRARPPKVARVAEKMGDE